MHIPVWLLNQIVMALICSMVEGLFIQPTRIVYDTNHFMTQKKDQISIPISNNESIYNRPSKSQRVSTPMWRYHKPKKSIWNSKKSKSFAFEVSTEINSKAKSKSKSNEGKKKHSLTLYKKSQETLEHCLCKALLWALYVDEYGVSNINVEQDIGDVYLPDVIAFPSMGGNGKEEPLFWGESGRMSPKKAADLCRRYPNTHIVHMRWGMEGGVEHKFVYDMKRSIEPYLKYRNAPFHVVTVSGDPRDFFDEDGFIRISKQDLEWKELTLS